MGQQGIVALENGKFEPTSVMFVPNATFTVSKGADTNDGVCNADCSLREAIVAANGAAPKCVTSISASSVSSLVKTRFAKRASGTVGPFELGSGSILSGAVASGQIGTNHLGSGAVVSGTIASGVVGFRHLANASVTSGAIASGQIFAFHLASGAVVSGLLGDAAIASGTIASGQVGNVHVRSGGLGSGAIGSGQISWVHHASGAIISGQVGNNAVNSGGVASGQIGQYHLASGAIIAYAQVNAPFLSGSFGQTLASEMISGVRAVAIDPNGRVRIAMAAVSGRMPAVGVVADNILSGMPVSLLGDGPVQFTSGMNDYSGFMEVSNDKVLVLADTAERLEELDLARAEDARKRAEVSEFPRRISPKAMGVPSARPYISFFGIH
jgi:CSLREA domain-containing protein